jgi:hypothetical protein
MRRVSKRKFPDARSVGAGLLAKAPCQQMEVYLAERVRQQAGSYRLRGGAVDGGCLNQNGCGRCCQAKV